MIDSSRFEANSSFSLGLRLAVPSHVTEKKRDKNESSDSMKFVLSNRKRPGGSRWS